MKLKQTYLDKYYNIKTFFYILPNGLSLVFTEDTNTYEYVMDITFKAGAYFEKSLGVPNGTAHLLEHLIEGKPNSFLDTALKLEDYTRGTRERAKIYSNAYTGRKLMGLTSYANTSAIDRMFNLFTWKLTDPSFAIDNFLNSEKNIVLGEIARKQSDKDDANYVYEQAFFSEYKKDYLVKVLGTQSSVADITKDHLLKYFRSLIRADNAVISIKGPELTKKMQERVLELDVLLAKDKIDFRIPEFPDHGLDMDFKYKYFKSKDTQGVFLSYSVVYMHTKKMDHKVDRQSILLDRFTQWALNEYLREEKNLVYSVGDVTSSTPIFASYRGFNTVVSKQNLAELFECMYNFIFEEGWKSYLFSERGKAWLDDKVSNYIFQSDGSIGSDYAESKGIDFLLGEFLEYDYEIAKQVMHDMQVEDIAERFEHRYLKLKPKVWINSNFKKEEILSVFESSRLFQKLSES